MTSLDTEVRQGAPVQQTEAPQTGCMSSNQKKAATITGVVVGILAVTAAAVAIYMLANHIPFTKAGLGTALSQMAQKAWVGIKAAGSAIGNVVAKGWATTTGKVAYIATGTYLLGVAAGAGALKYKQHRDRVKQQKAEAEAHRQQQEALLQQNLAYINNWDNTTPIHPQPTETGPLHFDPLASQPPQDVQTD